MRILLRNFFRGLLIFAPIAITAYLIYLFISWTDKLIKNLLINWIGDSSSLDLNFPGFGLISIFILLTVLGFLSRTFIIKPLLQWFDSLVNRMPLVKIVYGSLKDLFSAFVSDEKKFDKPVVVRLIKDGPVRLGFLTDENLEQLELSGMVSVYFPHSYNFSGNHYILPKSSITPVVGINSADIMRYVVSGGVVNINQESESDENAE